MDLIAYHPVADLRKALMAAYALEERLQLRQRIVIEGAPGI